MVYLFRGPAFKRSNTGFCDSESFLQVADAALVVSVLALSDETKVTPLIAFIHIDPIQFKQRLIPPIKGDEVSKKLSSVQEFVRDADTPPTVVWICLVTGP
jgi:hypothetical protein